MDQTPPVTCKNKISRRHSYEFEDNGTKSANEKDIKDDCEQIYYKKIRSNFQTVIDLCDSIKLPSYVTKCNRKIATFWKMIAHEIVYNESYLMSFFPLFS